MPRQRAKKLVLVLLIFASIMEASQKADFTAPERLKFQRVFHMYHLTEFRKFSVQVLINLGSKDIIMQPSCARKPNFQNCITNIGAQKIDGCRLETYKIVITLF